MSSPPTIHSLQDLIRRLDQVVGADCDQSRCNGVKDVLTDACAPDSELLDAAFLAPSASGYARRLLHKDPADRYAVMVMVWDGEQGTPLHDHGGKWCVECVYRGRIRVRSFSRTTNLDGNSGLLDFREETTVLAGQGEAGTLIPPFDYHILENPDPAPAVTIHVYGGELTACTQFEPQPGGGYRAVVTEMSYTE